MSAKNAIQRIVNKDMKEIQKNNLSEMGIFIHFDEENILKAKAMIIGPEDSPYENGILFFDIFFPSNYPFSPPSIKYYSRSKYRIHPNLYVGRSYDKYLGKVCLSVINTWAGPKWTSVMHIASLLIILQSILNKYPIENEPGFEKASIEKKELYNQIVSYDTFQNLIFENMIHIPEEYNCFQEEIQLHYHNKKDMINEKLCIKLEENKDSCKINSGVYNYTIVINYNNLKNKFDNYFKI